VGPRKHVLDGAQISMWRAVIRGWTCPGMLDDSELCKSG